MTTILGIDTATSGCSVALWQDSECLAHRAARMPRGQSEALAPMIDDVRGDAGIDLSVIDAIAVTRGPGAFTGLRIGLAAARALAMTLNVPCLGIGTFEALLAEAQATVEGQAVDILVIAIESKRDDIFLAAYAPDGGEVLAPCAALPNALAQATGPDQRVVIAGDAAAQAAAVLADRSDVRILPSVDVADALTVAALGADILEAGANAPAEPLYMRPPDVTLPA